MRYDILNEEGVKVAALKSKEEVTFVRRRREGLSLRTEQRRRKELGMSRKSGRPEEIDWNKVKADCLVRYKEGESVVSICKAHGISVSSFYRVVLSKGGNNA
jgi:hypothetical protein